MKTIKSGSQKTAVRWAAAVAALLAGLVIAESNPQIESNHQAASPDKALKEDEALLRGSSSPARNGIRIQSIQPNLGKGPAKDVAWLGVSTEEAPEALAAQLDFQSGEGLVVVYVAQDSPASKVGIEKYDVLVQLGDQLLVHPLQLRKLVRTKKEGDKIMLTLYRGGKKQTVSPRLGKTVEGGGMWLEGPLFDEKLHVALEGAIGKGIREQMENLHGTLAGVDASKQKIELEVQRSIEQARKSLQDALRHKAHGGGVLWSDSRELEALARGSVNVDKGATVVVKKEGSRASSMVKTDDTGTYVIVANPKKRLTAHDPEGKLLFDGEIETEEQQQKIPPDLWEKVEPMLQQMGPAENGEKEPRAQSDSDPNS